MLTELLSLTHWASGFWHFLPRKLSGLQKKCLGATRRPIYTSYFRGNCIFSCRFSLQLIHWVWIFAITSDHTSHNKVHRHAPWSRFFMLLASSTASWRTSWGDRNSLNLGFVGSTDPNPAAKTVGDYWPKLMGKTRTFQIEDIWE